MASAPRPDELSEADFQAALARVIATVFPTLRAEDIHHQNTFTIRLGHADHLVQGGAQAWAFGRSDIVLSYRERPLAVFELKRPGIALTGEDRRQGLSYARLLDPMAPLLVVSNGQDTKVFETFRGTELRTSGITEASVDSLLHNATRLAQADLRDAIGTLLGTDPKVWASAVRQLTATHQAELTGEWDDLLQPFPANLLLPRKASAAVQYILQHTAKIPIITGPPLSGKSNVLREVVTRNEDSAEFAFLFLDFGSSGHGVFQAIACLLSELFELHFSRDQVRAWLRSVSRAESGIAFVIAIDGVDSTALKPELDELVSESFGPRIRLVLAADEGEVRRLVLSTSGRQKTRVGNRAAIIPIGVLDDEEFQAAAGILYDHRLVFTHGSLRASEYRVPWLLRSIIGYYFRELNTRGGENVAVALPSVPGWEPLDYAMTRFSHDHDLIGQHGAIAEAVLRLLDTDLSVTGRLLLMTCYLCSPPTLAELLQESEIAQLVRNGYLKTTILEDGTRLFVPQLPHLVASMVALKLASQLEREVRADPDQAEVDFVRRCANLYNGEVVGARALLVIAMQTGEFPQRVLGYLLKHKPVTNIAQPGTRGVLLANGERFELEVGEWNQVFLVTPDGRRVLLSSEHVPDDVIRLHTSTTPWLILSHLANVPIGAFDPDTNALQRRVDLDLLLDIGACPMVLRRPEGKAPEPVLSHGIGSEVIVCHQEGIIEPITMALKRALYRDREQANLMIRAAQQRNSLALLSRINIALEAMEDSAESDVAAWAKESRETKVLPAFRGTLLAHDTNKGE